MYDVKIITDNQKKSINQNNNLNIDDIDSLPRTIADINWDIPPSCKDSFNKMNQILKDLKKMK